MPGKPYSKKEKEAMKEGSMPAPGHEMTMPPKKKAAAKKAGKAKMKVCPECGAKNAATKRKCVKCGASLAGK